MFSNSNEIKLETRNRNVLKIPNFLEINNTQLMIKDKPQVKLKYI